MRHVRLCVAFALLLGFAATPPALAGSGIDVVFADGFEVRVTAPCTSALCDLGFCASEGANCMLDADCCSLNCDGGTCGSSTEACGVQGTNCSAAGDCCSFTCAGTCASSGGNCGAIGEACTAANSCCSGFCAEASGAVCAPGNSACRCAPAIECRARGDLCSADTDCCNSYCDRPGGGPVGHCAALGSCGTDGEPCSPLGLNGSCCSNSCVDTSGLGAGTCGRLGGCLPSEEVCTNGLACCSGSCTANGTTTDGRPVMRCAPNATCQSAGEVCADASANCCPPGGGSVGCTSAIAGVNRCFGGLPGCVLPGAACNDTSECCTETFPNVQCQLGRGGSNVCCLSSGQSCAFGDTCCSGICAPNASSNLVCASGCLSANATCTTNTDCCDGSCRKDATGELKCATP